MSDTPPEAPAAAHATARAAVGPILVATAGDDGTTVLSAAARLADRSGAPVVVVSAVEPAPSSSPGIDGTLSWTPDLVPLLELRRERVGRGLREAMGDRVAWPVELVVDSAPRALAEAARAHRASLVVMGLGRHDLAARLLGGEVALRTVRRAAAPVLALPEVPFPVPARVAVAAVDFSPSSVRAARAALDLLDDGGTLHLVHVWSRTVIDHPALLARDDAYDRALPERFAAVERALRARGRAVTVVPTALLGEPAEAIVEFARAHDADLVAAGRRGHGLVERLLVGRVTTGLVRAAPCAVLVTPEPAGAERAELELALTGTAESRDRAEWVALLDAFTRRNLGRRTVLELDDPELGAQAQETGYAFLGATYDPHDRRVALMFGAPEAAGAAGAGSGAHLTRAVAGVTRLAIRDDAAGRDVALSVQRGAAQTLLTFLPEPR